jgi:hypothetical protein
MLGAILETPRELSKVLPLLAPPEHQSQPAAEAWVAAIFH